MCVLCARVWLAAQPIAMQTGVRAIAAFAPQSAGSGPNIADCLEIRTCACFLLRPSHAALCGLWPIATGLWPIANQTGPNLNQEFPFAGVICLGSGIVRCCVLLLCICGLQLVHMQAREGILIVIKPNTIAEKCTPQRHSQR